MPLHGLRDTATASAPPATLPNDVAAPVELRGVSKVYPGKVRALQGVGLRVAAGERVCLLGPNGAGKTTIIRLLNGALRPTSGEVLLFGEPSTSPRFLAAKRRAGVVPQGPGMYDDFTTGEYLELVRRLYGRGDPAAIAETFGLTPYLSRPLAQLSGGFQRRVPLAGALLSAPELLLLDEPTVGLDPLAARETHDFLRREMAGRTTLLCTHNLAEAEALCNSVIILRAGRVLLHEPIAALRRRFPRSVYLGARQGPAALAERLSLLGRVGRVDGPGVWVALGDPEQEVPDLLRGLLSSGLDVHECHVTEPSLEDMFVQLVQEAA